VTVEEHDIDLSDYEGEREELNGLTEEFVLPATTGDPTDEELKHLALRPLVWAVRWGAEEDVNNVVGIIGSNSDWNVDTIRDWVADITSSAAEERISLESMKRVVPPNPVGDEDIVFDIEITVDGIVERRRVTVAEWRSAEYMGGLFETLAGEPIEIEDWDDLRGRLMASVEMNREQQAETSVENDVADEIIGHISDQQVTTKESVYREVDRLSLLRPDENEYLLPQRIIQRICDSKDTDVNHDKLSRVMSNVLVDEGLYTESVPGSYGVGWKFDTEKLRDERDVPVERLEENAVTTLEEMEDGEDDDVLEGL